MEIMWKTTTMKRRLVIAAIAVTGLGLVAARLTFVDPAQAKQAVVLVQKGPVTAATEMATTGQIARLGVMNDGNKPVLARMVCRSADDFSVLPEGASVMMPIPARESRFFDIVFDLGGECRFRAAVIVVSAGPPNVSPSLQLFENLGAPSGPILGKTLIFADGFESGDVSAWSVVAP